MGGAEEPETVRGYMFWPPPECEHGDCLMKRGFEGLEVYTDTYVHHLQNPEVYVNTRAKQICGDDKDQNPCEMAHFPGPSCHPLQFRGMCSKEGFESGKMDCEVMPSGNSSKHRNRAIALGEVVEHSGSLYYPGDKRVCPYIEECQPREACAGANKCSTGYVS